MLLETKTIITSAAKDISSWLLDLLFPIRCVVCGNEDKEFLCLFCRSHLKLAEGQICIVCKKPSVGGITHEHCHNSGSPDGLVVFFDYRDPNVSNSIIQGKYSFIPGIFRSFARLIAHEILSHHRHLLSPPAKEESGLRPGGGLNTLVTAIPLHSRRHLWRGFNQSEVLAEEIAKITGLTSTNLLVRSKATKTQKDLKKEERTKNMESAFNLSPEILNHKSEILNHPILLIDDVTTTGSTFFEACKVLKQHGAQSVWCLSLARD